MEMKIFEKYEDLAEFYSILWCSAQLPLSHRENSGSTGATHVPCLVLRSELRASSLPQVRSYNGSGTRGEIMALKGTNRRRELHQ
jgi:hypothetical protein